MVMRNTQLETMEEGCCCQAGDFQEEIGRPGAVDPVHGLEVEEEGCHRAADQPASPSSSSLGDNRKGFVAAKEEGTGGN